MALSEKWTVLETTAIPIWKLGLWIWRDEGEWRLRLFRPWRCHKMIEIQCKDLLMAFYLLGLAAGWWKDVVFNDSKTKP